MITLLIADDEQLERQALRYIITRHCPCIDIIGEAGDGATAIREASQQKPDIVLLDIRMPEMNGLEAAKAIRAILPDAKIIMLTAFDEFEYAKQALKLGAVEYLLKPLRPEDLIKALQAVAEDVKQAKERIKEDKQMRKSLQEAAPYIKMSFIQDLISGGITELEHFYERAAFLGLEVKSGIVMVLDVDNFKQLTQSEPEFKKQLVKQQLYEIASEIAGPSTLVTPFSSDNIIIIIGSDIKEASLVKTDALNIANSIRKTVSSTMGISVTIGIGRYYSDPRDFHKSYLEALSAQRQRFYLGDNQIIHIEDIPHLSGQPFRYPFQNERTVVDRVRCGDRRQAKESLAKLLDEIFSKCSSIDTIKASVLELLIVLSRSAIEGGANLEQLTLLNFDHISRLIQCGTKDQVYRWMFDSLDSFLDNMLENRGGMNTRVVNKASEYIVKNCHKNISLEEVAQSVHLSPFYFSRLFKQEKGCNFVEFLTKARVDKAKSMLQCHEHTIVRVAAESGYHDASYFCRVFRQEVGMTPNQYRNELRKISHKE
ncbi:response regulator [Dendrosporobacter sp. 1207_IL3150]|uniref:response regulator n=1 Tax=Dendrosporobacter sp. 1207_IL3150 TaxID=3084054 RepID=UPI002FD92EC3